MTSFKTQPTVYAEDIQCILDPINSKGAIFISNVEAANNPLTLRKHNIKAILTAASNINISHPKTLIPHYKKVPGEDHENFNLSIYFDESVEFIENALKVTNVLVHCMAGVSRSVSLVLAYLIKSKGMTFEQAYKLVKSRRKIIYPNDGFIQQLKAYEKTHHSNIYKNTQRFFSPSKDSVQISEQLQSILTKYTSLKISSMTPTKHEDPIKKNTSVLSNYYQSPSKISSRFSVYESSRFKTQFSPLKNYSNIVQKPNRKSFLDGTQNMNLCKKDSLKYRRYQNQQQMQKKINSIRKKYSEISKGHQIDLGGNKNYLENDKLTEFQKYSRQKTYVSPSKIVSDKLKACCFRY